MIGMQCYEQLTILAANDSIILYRSPVVSRWRFSQTLSSLYGGLSAFSIKPWHTFLLIDWNSVYVLYNRKKALGAFLVIYLIGELGVALWLYTTPSLEREGRLITRVRNNWHRYSIVASWTRKRHRKPCATRWVLWPLIELNDKLTWRNSACSATISPKLWDIYVCLFLSQAMTLLSGMPCKPHHFNSCKPYSTAAHWDWSYGRHLESLCGSSLFTVSSRSFSSTVSCIICKFSKAMPSRLLNSVNQVVRVVFSLNLTWALLILFAPVSEHMPPRVNPNLNGCSPTCFQDGVKYVLAG